MAKPSVSAAAKSFDYDTAAELFEVQGRISRRRSCGYRRFDRAAEAIRFAVEDLPPKHFAGAYLEVDEARFDSNAIRRLYDSTDYPLPRHHVSPAGQPEDEGEITQMAATQTGGARGGSNMRIYVFKSETQQGLRAFAGDPDVHQLPRQHGPWTATGVIGPDSAPPHHLSRETIEKAIGANGFQLWRLRDKPKDAA